MEKKRPINWNFDGVCPSCGVSKGRKHLVSCEHEYSTQTEQTERNKQIVIECIENCGYEKVAKKYNLSRQRIYGIFQRVYPGKSPTQVALELIKKHK